MIALRHVCPGLSNQSAALAQQLCHGMIAIRQRIIERRLPAMPLSPPIHVRAVGDQNLGGSAVRFWIATAAR